MDFLGRGRSVLVLGGGGGISTSADTGIGTTTLAGVRQQQVR